MPSMAGLLVWRSSDMLTASAEGSERQGAFPARAAPGSRHATSARAAGLLWSTASPRRARSAAGRHLQKPFCRGARCNSIGIMSISFEPLGYAEHLYSATAAGMGPELFVLRSKTIQRQDL